MFGYRGSTGFVLTLLPNERVESFLLPFVQNFPISPSVVGVISLHRGQRREYVFAKSRRLDRDNVTGGFVQTQTRLKACKSLFRLPRLTSACFTRSSSASAISVLSFPLLDVVDFLLCRARGKPN